MIQCYVDNYVIIAGFLFFLGPFAHLVGLVFRFESDSSLTVFISKGLTTSTGAIVPLFIFSFLDKGVIAKVDGIEGHLAIAAMALIYFFVTALVPKVLRDRWMNWVRNGASKGEVPPGSAQ